ncbi:uncharacterized protein LOC121069782 isoform X2 [Cygnus olor]|uniref:uncharacterized protein LOC121069782 isoform X2 n=1 Tax=Cygnus olor TaxID=8869 RepID=UPI001ADE40E2|nr:uncharacterized protein LOC121069782 isoform X2 [Cygnus olor]
MGGSRGAPLCSPLLFQPHAQAATGPNRGTLLASPPRQGALRALQGRQHSPTRTPARSHSLLARPRSPAHTPGHLFGSLAQAWAPHPLLPPPSDAPPMSQQAGGAPWHKGAGTALAPERWPQRQSGSWAALRWLPVLTGRLLGRLLLRLQPPLWTQTQPEEFSSSLLSPRPSPQMALSALQDTGRTKPPHTPGRSFPALCRTIVRALRDRMTGHRRMW